MAGTAATTSGISAGQSHAQQVPNSVGTEPPTLRAPRNACDSHHHIYDPGRFPMPPGKGRPAPSNGTVSDYRLLQKRIGTTRSVVVQPRNYGIENEVTIDALKQLAPNSRGVAVVHPSITDAELKRFNEAGVRGIRFSLGDPASAVVKPEMIEPLAKRIANLAGTFSSTSMASRSSSSKRCCAACRRRSCSIIWDTHRCRRASRTRLTASC